MLGSAEGRKILKDRPRINSTTINMEQLAQYPEGSFGRAYVTWLERCGVTPDTREPVCILPRRLIHLYSPSLSGSLHLRSGIGVCYATLPRVPRLLSLHL